MLIESLYQYAIDSGLFSPFASRKFAFRLNLRDANGFVELVTTDDTVSVPKVERGFGVKPYHLNDTPEYALGLPNHDNEKAKIRAEQTLAAFWACTEEILANAGDHEALRAVQAAKADLTWVKKAQTLISATKRKSFIGLALGDTYLIERPLVRAYIEAQFAEQRRETGPDICMVTGKPCTALKTHYRIHGVPGIGIGAALISFHNNSTQTPGFEQGTNFPLSFEAMSGYTSALNALLTTNSAIITQTRDGQKMVVAGTCGVFWGHPEAKAIATVVNRYSKQEELLAAWGTLDRLQHVRDESNETVNMLILKGSKGRGAVLSYDLRPMSEVAKSLCRFQAVFSDASICSELYATGVTGAKEKQVLAVTTKVATVRALLLGVKPPTEVESTLKGVLDPRKVDQGRPPKKAKEVKKYWLTISQLQWLNFIDVLRGDQPPMHLRRNNPMKKHSNSEGPRIEDHVNEPDKLTERDLGVAFGRLIELGIVVKKRAHGQDMPFSFSAQANLARSNPAAWFAEFSRHLDHDEAKLRRKKKARYDIFLNMALGLASKLPPIPSKPLSIADIFRGYYAQRGFTMAYYAKWGAKAKKDANGDGTSDEGPNEDDEKIAAE